MLYICLGVLKNIYLCIYIFIYVYMYSLLFPEFSRNNHNTILCVGGAGGEKKTLAKARLKSLLNCLF